MAILAFIIALFVPIVLAIVPIFVFNACILFLSIVTCPSDVVTAADTDVKSEDNVLLLLFAKVN